MSERNGLGFKEYTKYEDGSQELRVTGPVFQYSNSIYYDKNGDGLVDIIKEMSIWSSTRVNNIQVRGESAEAQEAFNEGDKEMKHYMDLYK